MERMLMWKTFKRWLSGKVPPPNYDEQIVARRVYADYLRAQIAGFAPPGAATLLARLTADGRQGSHGTASFPDLMGVETQLVAAIGDALIERTYWIVRERFNRVAPADAQAEHSRWSPPGLVEPQDRVPANAPPAAAAAAAAAGRTGDTAAPIVDPAVLHADATARDADLRRERSLALAEGDDDPSGTDAADPPAAPAASLAGDE